MPSTSPLLTSASAADLSRLHELLDGLLAGQAVQPLDGLPAALARLRASAGPDFLEEAPGGDKPLQPAMRTESAAVSMLAFGAANALLMEQPDQVAPAGWTGSSEVRGLAQPTGQGFTTGLPAGPAAAQSGGSEAEWAAAGARDHAMLAAMDAAGLLPTQPGFLDFSAFPVGSAEPISALDQVIQQLDAQIQDIASNPALAGETITPAEIGAAAEALAAQPMPELLSATGEAAQALQVTMEQALEAAPHSPAVQDAPPEAVAVLPDLAPVLPDLAPVLENLAVLPAVVEDVADTVADVLENVSVVLEGGASSLAELAADLVEASSPSLPQPLADLLQQEGPTGELLASAVSSVPEVLDTVGAAVADLVGQLAEHGEQALGELGQGAGEVLEEIVAGAGEVLEAIGAEAGEVLQEINEGTGEVLEGTGEVFGEVVAGAGEVLDGINEGTGEVLEGTGEVLVALVEEAGTALDALVQAPGDKLEALAGSAGVNVVQQVLVPAADAEASIQQAVDDVLAVVGEPSPAVVPLADIVSDLSGGAAPLADTPATDPEGTAAEPEAETALAPVPSVTEPVIDTAGGVGELVAGLLDPAPAGGTLASIVDAVSPPAPAPASEQPLEQALEEPSDLLARTSGEATPADASDQGLSGDLPSIGAGALDGAAELGQLLPGLLKPTQ